MTQKQPDFETTHYKVVVQVIPGDYTLPQFTAVNKEFEVVEFANPCFLYVKSFIDQLEEQYDALAAEEAPAEPEEEQKGYN